ncbi:MAG: hypothetical protein ACKPJ4_04915, partial [Dolichospermum sp.]
TALTDVMRYKVTPPPTPSPLFERGLNMYLIRAETPVILLLPMITTLVSLLVGLEVLNSKVVFAKPIKSPIIKGQCGRKQKCETLFKR